MINVEHLDKTYHLKNADVHAVDDVSLHIESGQIYGVIGYSGAGKSTLVRCLNFLEIPDSGSIEIEGFGKVNAKQGSLDISQKKLRELRQSIGMIFQHFNLLDRSTVFDNVAYPLKYTGLSKKEIETRVDELLDLVDLADKKYVYPSQLSGGQKQRVAIARALSNNPKVLLSDEATSALDPDATESILKLLKDLNKRLGITIILITHEMSVIKSIANRVAVMENGKVVEEGDVYDIFANPKEEITKKFINSSSSLSNITKLIENKTIIPRDSKLVKLTFTRDSVGSATISKISREYNVDVNIMLANVDVVNADALGGIIASIEGNKEDIQDAINYLHASNVKVEVIHHA
ncbi:methionine ABC transporter ATP-binding protein [Holdemanella biformis]|uniref:methionine ABC transporter ATP-binding protein n=1 Tax=Holdemanella biformis TaxID=1735 RepID=UPI002E77850F|nr:ATP-binding cassette domain-containing protein [Holdemanella biformis]MEE0396500.1 ATP-binding cassette domain-containing protein [Holdemanella biformis]